MNLIIGNTSQQSYYYPEDYIRISSRNINFNFLKNNIWDSVYITFAEQSIYNDDNVDFLEINFNYTLKVIDNLIDNSDKIVIFTTSELWNNCNVKIGTNTHFNYKSDNYNYFGYLYSKERLYNEIIDRRLKDGKYNKVIIIHPFNFNSVYRKKEFLFGKIFNSIINKVKIEIDNTYYYRDIIHTKYLVDRVINAKEDEIVGSGRIFHVNDFIRDLYRYFKMDYDYYVTENITNNNSKNIYYSYQEIVYTYDMLFNDTVNDIKNKI